MSTSKNLVVLAHTDPLPMERGLLEGRLNQHISQLQGLAKDIEWVNEAIDMKKIILQRLIRDAEAEVLSPSGKKKEKVRKDDKAKAKKGESSKSIEGKVENMGVKEMDERLSAFRKLKGILGRSVLWQLDEMGRVEKELGTDDVAKSKRFGTMEPHEFENILSDRKWSNESYVLIPWTWNLC